MIRALQIFLHVPMMMLSVPGNVSMLFEIIIPVATFDIFEYASPVEKALIFDDNKHAELVEANLRG